MTKIAFDIGGTYIKSAIVEQDGTLKDYQKVQTPVNEGDAIVNVIKLQLQQYIEKHDIQEVHVGISTAGAVDRDACRIAYANPNIRDYTGTDFAAHLAPYIDELRVYNDVDAALLGELTVMPKPVESLFCLTLGTGIGGSYYNSDLGLMTGARHRPNQIGNLLYDPLTKTNYEQRASTNGLKRFLTGKGYAYHSIAEWFDLASKGDEHAKASLQQWGEEVARGIAEIQIIYDPAEIVIGGGVSAQGANLLQFIVPQVEKYLPEGYGHATIRTAQLQNHAALIGAVSEV
ncbi:ROK family protein [Staphylococcus americanisciuri]|uniref:ROK family protein n=1 Tax=Staphylococcus americanisciuri TaxID=2973940 RepID=A0ABT2F178_9STAP|nr:ROK family protein [Staphylococcus americanisciuri]MCS4486026.1 ROK family protein [Staphylococcus americanisciuri]